MDEIGRMEDLAGQSMSKESGGWRRSISSGGGGGGAWSHGNPFSLGKASPRLGPIGGQRTAAKPIPRKASGGGEV